VGYQIVFAMDLISFTLKGSIGSGVFCLILFAVNQRYGSQYFLLSIVSLIFAFVD
jgi:hypothetical protein